MKTNKTLSVKFQGNLVGTLASMEDGKIAFEYADRIPIGHTRKIVANHPFLSVFF